MINAAVPANEKITAFYDSVYLFGDKTRQIKAAYTESDSHIHLTSIIIQSCLLL